MRKENLSKKLKDKNEEIVESKEDLKGNKILIFLCNLMDPIHYNLISYSYIFI